MHGHQGSGQPYHSDQYHPYMPPIQLPTSHQPAYPPPWVYQNPLPRPPAYTSPPTLLPQPYTPQAGPSRSEGRDYLLSLQTSMSNLDIAQETHRQRTISSPGTDKPLPRLPPPPPLPNRPYSTNAADAYSSNLAASTNARRRTEEQSPTVESHDYSGQQNRHSTPGQFGASSRHSTSTASTSQYTPPRSFRPSINLTSPSRLHPPHSEPRISRPYSDTAIPLVTPSRKKQPKPPRTPSIIIIDSDSDTSASSSTPVYVTTRTPARRKRATSENPSRSSRHGETSLSSETPKRTLAAGSAVRCAGFTRKGAPCQRLVKAEAPYLTMIDPNVEEGNGIQARYCKNHAGMICNVKGFYWKSNKEKGGIWVEFEGESS